MTINGLLAHVRKGALVMLGGLVLLRAVPAVASPVSMYGAENISMAGTGVGLPTNFETFDVNPAVLATSSKLLVSGTFGGYYVEANNFYNDYKGANEILPSNPYIYSDPLATSRLVTNLREFGKDGVNFFADSFKGIMINYSNFGFEVQHVSLSGDTPGVDLKNISPVAASFPQSIANNASYVRATGMILTSYAAGYGFQLPGLTFGARMAWMQSESYFHDFSIYTGQLTSLDGFVSNAFSGPSKFSNSWTADLGGQLQIGSGYLGFNYANIHPPTFSTATGGTLSFAGTPTIGVGYTGFQYFSLGGDFDLIGHNDPTQNTDVRILRIGIEGKPLPTLSIRAGYFQNTLGGDTSVNFTGGIGTTLFNVLTVNYGMIFTQTFELKTMAVSMGASF